MASTDEPVEPYTLSFYYPGLAQREPDGSLAIGASWWDHGGHTSGMLFVRPDDPDYEFWQWLVANPQLFPRVDDENLATAREAFAKRHRDVPTAGEGLSS